MSTDCGAPQMQGLEAGEALAHGRWTLCSDELHCFTLSRAILALRCLKAGAGAQWRPQLQALSGFRALLGNSLPPRQPLMRQPGGRVPWPHPLEPSVTSSVHAHHFSCSGGKLLSTSRGSGTSRTVVTPLSGWVGEVAPEGWSLPGCMGVSPVQCTEGPRGTRRWRR